MGSAHAVLDERMWGPLPGLQRKIRGETSSLLHSPPLSVSKLQPLRIQLHFRLLGPEQQPSLMD